MIYRAKRQIARRRSKRAIRAEYKRDIRMDAAAGANLPLSSGPVEARGSFGFGFFTLTFFGGVVGLEGDCGSADRSADFAAAAQVGNELSPSVLPGFDDSGCPARGAPDLYRRYGS